MYQLNDEDISKIADWLTDEQRAYGTDMVKYLLKMGAKDAEVSIKLNGFSIFGED